MKLLVTFLLVFNSIFNINLTYEQKDVNNIDEETKEVINRENKNGMTIALVGALIILEISLIYKKKKIKL